MQQPTTTHSDKMPPEADPSGHTISPSDIAVGVIIGRTSEFFDFFVFAIATVIVFPLRYFPFLDPLHGFWTSAKWPAY